MLFVQGDIVKSKERNDLYPKFVMVLFDPHPIKTQFKGVVIYCKHIGTPSEDEFIGYTTNTWNTDKWELTHWDEVKKHL